MIKIIPEAYTFDDVLIVPKKSNILPANVNLESYITKNIKLNIPVISAAMDSVTEKDMAVAMAQNGGIGCIHKNLTIEEQAKQVREVKKHEAGMVTMPITVYPEMLLRDAIEMMQDTSIFSIPVINKDSRKIMGILSNRDIRFAENYDIAISNYMTPRPLVMVKAGISTSEAKKLLHQHRIEKLIVVNEKEECIGLITVKDIENDINFPNAAKDQNARLRVAAATGIGIEGMKRADALVEAGVDLIVIDTAHGHSKGVVDMVGSVRRNYPSTNIIAGNIATYDAARELIDAGVDGVKVGIGPGSICTTRIIAGVGVPQLTAIMQVKQACLNTEVKLIADGGIKQSGDIAKAIAAGADIVMMGGMLAGVDETPGDIILYQGRTYKSYRGMGSLGAMVEGSADRYFQDKKGKLVPEGVEGRVPSKGKLGDVLYQMMGGLRASMGYTGSENITAMQTNNEFVKITNAGLRESHAHDVVITHEAPNYAT
jgi:IMP dehydrogenase